MTIFPDSDEVELRRAEPGDAPTIVDFQLRMARETEEMELDPDVVGRGVAAVFEEDRGHYRLAEIDGRIVASLLVLEEWSDWRNGVVWWIHSVYVVPEARRRGLFRRLYAQLRQEVVDSPDLRGLRLYVDRRNTAARSVYESLGMNRNHYELFEWMPEG